MVFPLVFAIVYIVRWRIVGIAATRRSDWETALGLLLILAESFLSLFTLAMVSFAPGGALYLLLGRGFEEYTVDVVLLGESRYALGRHTLLRWMSSCFWSLSWDAGATVFMGMMRRAQKLELRGAAEWREFQLPVLGYSLGLGLLQLVLVLVYAGRPDLATLLVSFCGALWLLFSIRLAWWAVGWWSDWDGGGPGDKLRKWRDRAVQALSRLTDRPSVPARRGSGA